MSIEENKQSVVRFFDALRIADAKSIDELTTDDFMFRPMGGGGGINKEKFIDLVVNSVSAFPDHSSSIDDMVAEGDKVAVRMTSTGTHLNQWGKHAPTGRYFSIPEVFILRFENGKIAEDWGLKDALGHYQQLGLLPPYEEIG
jgi:steroid delta-isomerase-like uncharacterized protein